MRRSPLVITVFLAALLFLVVGSHATQTTSPLAWVSFGAQHSLRIQSGAGKFMFSPDGNTLAGFAEGRIELRDVTSGRTRYAFSDPGEAVIRIAFNPTSDILAGVTESARIILWDVESGFRRAVLSGHNDVITAMVFSPD